MTLPFPSEGQWYLESFKDKDGSWLDGSQNYKLHVPANVPAKEFWSVTVYDNLTRSMTMNKANKPAVRFLRQNHLQRRRLNRPLLRPESAGGLEANWGGHYCVEGMVRLVPLLCPDGALLQPDLAAAGL